MLNATLTLDPTTGLLQVSLATLPVGTGCVALYRNVPGQAAHLLAAVAPGAGPGVTLSTRAETDGVYRLQAFAFDAFALAGQPAPVLLDQTAELSRQVTRQHEADLASTYASHACNPRPPGASLALYLRKFARLTEATTVWQEGDLFHAHAYLQTP